MIGECTNGRDFRRKRSWPNRDLPLSPWRNDTSHYMPLCRWSEKEFNRKIPNKNPERYHYTNPLGCTKNKFSYPEDVGSAVGIVARGWSVRGSNSSWGGGENFRTRPDRSWGPPSLPCYGYRVFPRVKWPEIGVDHLHPSRTEVKERVQLYLYFHSGLSWPFLGWTLLLLLPFTLASQTIVQVQNKEVLSVTHHRPSPVVLT